MFHLIRQNMDCCGLNWWIRRRNVLRIQKDIDEKSNVTDLVIANQAADNSNAMNYEMDLNSIKGKKKMMESPKEELQKQLTDIGNDSKKRIQNENIEMDILRAKVNAGEKKELIEKFEAEQIEVEGAEEPLKTLQEYNTSQDFLWKIADQEVDEEKVQQQQINIEYGVFDVFENLQKKLQLTLNEKTEPQIDREAQEKDVLELMESVEKRTKEKNDLVEHLKILKHDIAKLTNDIACVEEEKEKLKEKDTIIRQEIFELSQNVKIQKSERNSLLTKQTLYDKDNLLLRAQITAAKSDNDELKKYIEERKNERGNLVERSINQENEDTFRQEESMLLERLIKAENERDDLRLRIKTLMREEDKSDMNNKCDMNETKAKQGDRIAVKENLLTVADGTEKKETPREKGDMSNANICMIKDDKLHLKTEGVFSLPIDVSRPQNINSDEEGDTRDWGFNISSDSSDTNESSDSSDSSDTEGEEDRSIRKRTKKNKDDVHKDQIVNDEGKCVPTLDLTDSSTNTTDAIDHFDLAEIERTMRKMSMQTENKVHAEEPVEDKPEGFISDLELEKIAQSNYRYSYHQYVENYQENEEEDD